MSIFADVPKPVLFLGAGVVVVTLLAARNAGQSSATPVGLSPSSAGAGGDAAAAVAASDTERAGVRSAGVVGLFGQIASLAGIAISGDASVDAARAAASSANYGTQVAGHVGLASMLAQGFGDVVGYGIGSAVTRGGVVSDYNTNRADVDIAGINATTERARDAYDHDAQMAQINVNDRANLLNWDNTKRAIDASKKIGMWGTIFGGTSQVIDSGSRAATTVMTAGAAG